MVKAAGMFVMAAFVLLACGEMPQMAEQQAPGVEQLATASQELGSNNKDCSVSIRCSDGTSRSCSGSSGACAASGSGYGSVTCNSATTYCPNCTSNGVCNTACASGTDPDCGTSSCTSDGFCDTSCASDPDCGADYCVGGAFCSTAADCAYQGSCSNGRCLCY